MSGDHRRVSVQTYVSTTQRDLWRREAEELDMNQAEYVRTMVQAGRRGFDLGRGESVPTDHADNEETTSSDVTPGVDGLEMRILEILRENEFADWETLLAGVTDDVESRLEETLEKLQAADRIRHSGRHGGYAVVDDGR